MSEIYMNYGPLLLGAIITMLVWLYARFLHEKIKATKAGQMLYRFGGEVRAVVREVSNTYVDELKRSNADGVLTEEEKKKAMAMAIKKLKSNIGVEGLKRMVKILGIDALEGWLETQVESSIAEIKIQREPLPRAVALPPKK